MVEILGPSRLLMEETKAVVHGRKPCVMGRGYKPMAAPGPAAHTLERGACLVHEIFLVWIL